MQETFDKVNKINRHLHTTQRSRNMPNVIPEISYNFHVKTSSIIIIVVSVLVIGTITIIITTTIVDAGLVGVFLTLKDCRTQSHSFPSQVSPWTSTHTSIAVTGQPCFRLSQYHTSCRQGRAHTRETPSASRSPPCTHRSRHSESQY